MKYFKYIILCFSISFVSCNGFLDLESPDGVTDEKVFTTMDGLRAARIGMYAAMAQNDYYGGFYPLMASCHSDDGANGGFSIVAYDEFGNKTLTADNLLLQNTWLAMYNTIAVANKVIANVANVPAADAEKADKARFTAEAYFIRALVHLDVLRCWGEHWDLSSTFGIPVVTTPQGFDNRITRATVAETYDAMTKDIKAAEGFINEAKTAGADFSDKNFITPAAVTALKARIALYKNDKSEALTAAKEVIDQSDFELLEAVDYAKIFSSRKSSESIFEVGFNTQNRSSYNTYTYSREFANRQEVVFLAAEDLNTFFKTRKDDVRAKLVNFTNNDQSIQPDGRTEKYRGEQTRDNPAYVLRLAEMYLIAAEAEGRAKGVGFLNNLREKRGLSKATVATDDEFKELVLAERRAELNWEGHRYFDLARMGKVESVIGKDVKPTFPIPARELVANSKLVQNKGY